MSSRTVQIIDALYGNELRAKKRSAMARLLLPRKLKVRRQIGEGQRRVLALYRERERLMTRGKIAFLLVTLIITSAFVVSIIYYNRLTLLEQDVFKEVAKIDTLLQRRRNISTNLARTVRDYAIHEQGIFNHVSNMRTSNKSAEQRIKETYEAPVPPPLTSTPTASANTGSAQGGDVLDQVLSLIDGKGNIPFENKLAGLLAVAENYPDLKLSQNFQKFMEALIETEKDISNQRMAYSDVVNNYTSQLRTFPGRMFAVVYGFEPFPYFQADNEAKMFNPVEY